MSDLRNIIDEIERMQPVATAAVLNAAPLLIEAAKELLRLQEQQ